MTTEASVPTFLSLPPELRNQIYHLLYVQQEYCPSTTKGPIKPLELTSFGRDTTYDNIQTTTKNNGNLLRVCRQIHHETHLLYWDTSLFHLTGAYAEPKAFDSIVSAIPRSRQSAIKHIVLTAKLNHLRCLNEQWNSVPFGNDSLSLDTLTIIPIKPEIHGNLYEEVVDLNQSHTIAHVLTETLKSLRNVRVVVLRNEGCYKPVVWKLLYSGLVYRLWRWGGRLCGLGFRELISGDGFEILSGDAHEELKARSKEERLDEASRGWKDIEEEMDRLMGLENRDGRVEPTQPGWNVA
ncbi:hypothetical protein MBLNU457_4882t1 [Dothideomycetes sp. NU457]